LNIEAFEFNMKTTRLGSALVILALILSCTTQHDRRTHIELWGLGVEGEIVSKMIPDFERRYPDIQVTVQQIPWTAAHEKLLTAYVGESTPDLAQMGNTWIPEFVAVGALDRLDQRVAASKAIDQSDYFPGIWETNKIDGVLYGVPWYVDTRVLFYRTDLFAAAGFHNPPQTWSEWMAACRAIKARQSKNQYPILIPTNEWAEPVTLGLDLGATLLGKNDTYGAFRDPRFVKAFDFYLSFFRKGYAPVLSNSQVANRYQQFGNGDFAMLISGPWDVGELKKRLPPKVKWMTAPMPAPDGTPYPGLSLAGGSSLVLFKGSPRKEAAWKLVEYLSEPAQQLRFFQLSQDLPARKSAWHTAALEKDPFIAAFRQQLERVAPTPKVPEWEEIATAVFDYAEPAIRGAKSEQQALAGLDAKADQILTKRRWVVEREKGEK
jgi:multiple sugar transport system substrate-binding protein